MKFSHLPRIYANIKLIESCLLHLPPDNSYYLTKVLRLKIGDNFRVFNGIDGEFIAQVTNIAKSNLSFKIKEIFRTPHFEPVITLGMAIIKSDRMLDAINMAVQLGVTSIVPLVTQRVQMRNINSQKLLKCIIEYTQQSERLAPPVLEPVMPITAFLEKKKGHFVIYANENENEHNTLFRFSKDFSSLHISIIVGPEGGFSPDELKILSLSTNCRSISLGSTVLRSETAVASILAQLKLLSSVNKI